MTNTSELMATAIQHHQAGRLSEAEPIYRQVLQSEPNHADALHLLGVIALQSGNPTAAVQLIGKSLQQNEASPNAYSNLGSAFRALNRPADAATCYRRAIDLQPDYAEAHINLGNVLCDQGQLPEATVNYRRAAELKPNLARVHAILGNVLLRQKQAADAVASYRSAIALQPDDVETLVDMGNALKDQGQLAEAEVRYRRALELKPKLEIALLNLGVVLRELGRLEEAVLCYRQALDDNPRFAEAYNNLGIALNDLGQGDEAIKNYRLALGIKSDYAEACNNLGNSLSDQGRLDDAIVQYRRALAIQPGFAAAHGNLGTVLKRQGKLVEASECYRQAIALDPGTAEAHSNLGATLKAQGKLDEAIESCQTALKLNPRDADAWNHLGNVLKDQGELNKAIDCYRRAMELNPADACAHDNLIYTHLFCPSVSASELLKEHEQWNRRHAAPLANPIQPFLNNRDADRRLRIGYISPDFRNHVVGRNLIPLFEEHDHKRFDVYCYADVPSADDLTRRFISYADTYRVITGHSDEQVAETIRRDQIDILVDLTLHMASNRLLVFARKPAPVQVTFAGYPGTTGVSTIDYRLTDPYLDPPNQPTRGYSEESIRLPHSFWCYDPLESESTVQEPPALHQSRVTFGCLNNFCKVNAGVLELWARVLNAVDRSRLIMLAGEGSHRQKALQVFAAHGVMGDRITFVANQPRQLYLQTYHSIDIGLDTFPYNGHATSLDSYWMGVPVVTLIGETVVGRAGFSQLSNLGLTDLVGRNADQFVEIAVALANDLPRLTLVRSTLRERMRSSPLMSATEFTRGIEGAFREIWRRWCA